MIAAGTSTLVERIAAMRKSINLCSKAARYATWTPCMRCGRQILFLRMSKIYPTCVKCTTEIGMAI